ncbi:MAG: FtsX-like permease family protein [Pseudomonadota bacterium]|nr:FtsX-like permease family protein [Pseudomonadota bacterium]
MNSFYWPLQRLKREWRYGELRVLVTAVAVAVMAITSVGFFTDRVDSAITKRSAEVMAADLVVRSRSSIPPDYIAAAGELGLQHALLVEFPSVMVTRDDSTVLVAVKAVGSAYPLRGKLVIAAHPDGTPLNEPLSLKPGRAWGDARLWIQGGLAPGAVLTLGRLDLTLDGVIEREPDRGQFGFDLAAPRIMMRIEDLPATGLVTAASRVRYRLLLSGNPEALQRYRQWFSARQGQGQGTALEIEGVGDERPVLQSALDRAASYLGLASLTAVIVAGAAIALAARLYARRQTNLAAVMRALGASQSRLLREFVVLLVLVACAGTLIGLLLGLIAQAGLGYFAAQALAVALPWPSPQPVLAGLVAGLVMTVGFGIAPVAALRQVSVMRLMRQQSSAPNVSSLSLFTLAMLSATGLIFWQAQDIVLAAWVVVVTLGLLLGLSASGWLFFAALRRMRFGTSSIRYVFASLGRRPAVGTLQLCAFGVGIMALLMLMIIRTDLLNSWSSSIPPTTPNHFVINIQPQQVKAFETALSGAGLVSRGLFPMVRGRWIDQNGRAVEYSAFPTARAQRLASREFNLSAAAKLPSGNKIVAGRWFTPTGDGQTEWSIEEGLAQTLGIRLGDELGFEIAGQTISGKVTSLRQVRWDSFEVNFFVIASSGALAAYPATYICSFYMPPERHSVIANLVRQFPGATVFDVDILLTQVREIIDQVGVVVQYVFAFTLLAGIIVLIAAVQSGARERLDEVAVLRALGASQRRLQTGLLLEFVILGGASGIVAALFAALSGYVLAQQVFGVTFVPGVSIWVIGFVAGAVGVGLTGMVAIYAVFRHPPMSRLQSV